MMNKRKIATKKIFASVLCLTAAATLTGQQGATKDPYQRSAEIYQMKTSAAEGPQRGEEIYYYKCWYCHNKYAKTGPSLKDIFKREPLEGIMVQLISTSSGIRSTVYSDVDGRYEFPILAPGTYALRIARPLEFKPYVRESVRIEGATSPADIVLERVTDKEVLPPTPEILAQLTGAEWMLNLPGNGEEKRTFSLTCGFGCHSYQQIFRTRYVDAGWRSIVRRMMTVAGSPLINVREPGPQNRGRAGRPIG